jgi:hypothetical protein
MARHVRSDWRKSADTACQVDSDLLFSATNAEHKPVVNLAGVNLGSHVSLDYFEKYPFVFDGTIQNVPGRAQRPKRRCQISIIDLAVNNRDLTLSLYRSAACMSTGGISTSPPTAPF